MKLVRGHKVGGDFNGKWMKVRWYKWGKGSNKSGGVKWYTKQGGLVEKGVCEKITLKKFGKDIQKASTVEAS